MATGITGRLIRRTTKEPLQGITVVAVNASTGAESSTSTTTDTKGFFELNGLTSAVYFAKPLVSGDDWDLLPNIAEIYTDEIHIAADGSLTVDGTYSGSGSYQALNVVPTLSGAPTSFISINTGVTKTSGGGSITTLSAGEFTSGTASSSTPAITTANGVVGRALSGSSGGSFTSLIGVHGFAQANVGTITDAIGVKAEINASPGAGTTNSKALLVVPANGGTNDYGIYIDSLASAAANYAIYSSATAQSEFAGSIKSSSDTGGVGYATGAGGTVTQLTSKSTSVTNNNICGEIVTHNAALAAGASVVFLVNNTTVDATDVVLVNIHDSGAGMTDNVYRIEVAQMGTDYFNLRLTNLHSLSLSEPVSINFAVIKAVAA